MTSTCVIPAVTPVAIPDAAMTAAIKRLNSKGFEASVLQPDEGPAEIAVNFLPYRRENAMATFMRAQHDTTYWRVWGAADGTIRVTNDEFDEEWSYGDLAEAVSALVGSTKNLRRA